MNVQSRYAMPLLVTGLMIITLSLVLGRQFAWPDAVRGMVTGFGISLGMLALISVGPQKKKRKSVQP